jgi:glycosyltransferase involved in cell wall biosynthesis
MLEQITPLILTYNEAPNIARTLGQLKWARDIVVVDSNSTDETPAILATFPNVRVYSRAFDNHAAQWNFGLRETGISTPWVLALDADYIVTDPLVAELRGLAPADAVAGYWARFRYCVNGRPLRGSAYPPVTALYRRALAGYVQDGHTQRVRVEGQVLSLAQPIHHDDRKPLRHWVMAQERYMRLEVVKLRATPWARLGWADRLRRMRVVAPFVMLVYCLFARGAIFDGRAGIYYAMQRCFAELLLSLCLLEGDIFGPQ